MVEPGSDTIDRAAAAPAVGPATLRKRMRHAALLALGLCAGCLAVMALPTAYLVRYGGFPPGKLLPAVVGFPILSTALLFTLGVVAISRRTVSMRPIYCHAAVWAAVLIAATLLFASHVQAIGWQGAGWVRFLGAAAVTIGLPFGATLSARIITRRQQFAVMKADRPDRALAEAAAAQWRGELDRTYQAIRKYDGRNTVSSQYSLAASQALSRLLASDELAEANPARIARLREFRAKLEAGEALR